MLDSNVWGIPDLGSPCLSKEVAKGADEDMESVHVSLIPEEGGDVFLNPLPVPHTMLFSVLPKA